MLTVTDTYETSLAVLQGSVWLFWLPQVRAESQSVREDQELIQISAVTILHPCGDDDDEPLWPTWTFLVDGNRRQTPERFTASALSVSSGVFLMVIVACAVFPLNSHMQPFTQRFYIMYIMIINKLKLFWEFFY